MSEMFKIPNKVDNNLFECTLEQNLAELLRLRVDLEQIKQKQAYLYHVIGE